MRVAWWTPAMGSRQPNAAAHARANPPDRRRAAAAMLAAGLSAERMGELDDARLRYESVLLIEPGHARAGQRLRAIGGR